MIHSFNHFIKTLNHSWQTV